MAVYILKPEQTAYCVNRQVAAVGFTLRGEDVRLFERSEFDNLPLRESDVVFAGFSYARRAFERLGFNVPHLDYIPQETLPFAGRDLWLEDIGTVRKRVQDGEQIFFKPTPDRPKLFAGQVASQTKDLIATANAPNDTIVFCSEPVRFVSEHRAFVLHGELIGLRHYQGDPLAFPNPDTVRAAIAAYATAPAAYAYDFGVTDDGRTLVVEVNDGYSSGAYGLSPLRYARVISARWDEIRSSHHARIRPPTR